jgi:hypothetical protein
MYLRGGEEEWMLGYIITYKERHRIGTCPYIEGEKGRRNN